MGTNNITPIQWYTTTCDTYTFTLPVRYQELNPLGRGSFSAVM